MKNQLSPLSPSATSPGEYEPALVEHGYRVLHLPALGYVFRADLDGLVHDQRGPIVEIEERIYQVIHPAPDIVRAWSNPASGRSEK